VGLNALESHPAGGVRTTLPDPAAARPPLTSSTASPRSSRRPRPRWPAAARQHGSAGPPASRSRRGRAELRRPGHPDPGEQQREVARRRAL